MTTTPELWTYAQGARQGVTSRAEQHKLWGKFVKARKGKVWNNSTDKLDARLHAVATEALIALRAQAISRHRSETLARGAAPFLWSGFFLQERAVVVTMGKGKAASVVPIAHIGPDGFTPLTEQDATASMKGRKDQEQASPPRSGFASSNPVTAAAQAVEQGMGKLSDMMKSPVVTVPVSLTGATVTAFTAYNVLETPLKAAWARLKAKVSM